MPCHCSSKHLVFLESIEKFLMEMLDSVESPVDEAKDKSAEFSPLNPESGCLLPMLTICWIRVSGRQRRFYSAHAF